MKIACGARAPLASPMVNPYQAPIDAFAPLPVRVGKLDDLRRIARHQRAINLAILAQLGLMGFAAMAPAALTPVVRLVGLVISIATIVATFRLAKALHSTWVAVVCTPLMLVPLVNLLTLLVFSSQATKRLRDAGFKVGLLGGNPADIR